MKGFIFFVILIMHLYNLNAQPIKIYTNNDGLSKNSVTAILKDSKGFMWFGTAVGLNRFDGYFFKAYFHNESDSMTLCNNNIRKILEDANGDLWIATTNGLSRYNYNTDNFTNYFHVPQLKGSLSNNYINSIFIDEDKKLWVTTSEGFDKFLTETNTFQHFVFNSNERGVSENKAIYDITQDSKGIFWLCIEGNGLVSFSKETEQYSIFKGDNVLTPVGNRHDGKFFAKSANGVLKIIAENGVFDFNLQTKVFSRSLPLPKNSNLNKLGYDPLVSAYTDNTGTIWINIPNKGIIQFDSTRNQFESYSDVNTNYGLIDKSVHSMREDEKGKIWIGTSIGICTFDPDNKTFTNLSNSSKAVYKISQSITSMIFDSYKNLWIGTSSGLYYYNTKAGILKSYFHHIQDTSSLVSDVISSIFEDSKGNIWVGAGGLNLYNKAKDNFKQFRPSKNSDKTVNSEYIVRIYEDKSGILWINTWAGGINIYHPDTRKFSFITANRSPESIIKSNDIGSIVEDSKGFMWFTSNYGISKYNPLIQKTVWYSTKDGLIDNTISDVLEDNNGNIWISTRKGISMLNTKSQRFKSFDATDGLQANEFTFNTAIKSRNGNLYFGGTNGFSIINPNMLKDNKIEPIAYITDLKIFNNSVHIGENINGSVILPQNIVVTKSITLSHQERYFSLEFTALHYTNPEKNQYAYMLEGFDKDWNITTAQRRYVTYTNLDPGKYLFKVKASNCDGVWNKTPTTLEIIILPPWWKTIWFKIILGAFLLALIQILYYVQLKSIRNKKKKLEGLVRLRTNDLELANGQLESQKSNLEKLNAILETNEKEIEQQKEEISQQNIDLRAKNSEILTISQRAHDLDQMKLRYFTNISHEFRTPITLIVSPLDRLLDSGGFDEKHLDLLTIIKNSSNRLLRLVNQLLDIGKLDSGTMSVKKTEGDFVRFAETIIASFKGQAEQRSINLKFETDLQDLTLMFDFDKMEKILFNLLSNSFKFIPESGSVKMILGLSGDFVSISISDSGIGISKENLTKIFDPFYQVDSSNTRFHEGSGIGLFHTQELVSLLNGSIEVSSIVGKGTTFVVLFPLEYADFRPAVNINPENGIQIELQADNRRSSKKRSANEIMEERNPLLLLVEDNQELRQYIKSEFSHTYTVIEAANGKQGLGMIYEYHPDIIISDIMMPEMDGLEMCKRIKGDEQISHIPIILLTAKADEADVIGGIENGADEYITKPFNIKHLYAKVDQLLVSRRKLKEKFSNEVFFEPSDITFTNTDKRFFEKLIKLVEDNIDNDNFQVADIAQEVGMGKTNLYKKVQALTNQSVADFVRTIRLKTAAKLLLTNEYSVSEVSFKVGFKDASHFIKSFTRQYKLTPKRFIDQHPHKKG